MVPRSQCKNRTLETCSLPLPFHGWENEAIRGTEMLSSISFLLLSVQNISWRGKKQDNESFRASYPSNTGTSQNHLGRSLLFSCSTSGPLPKCKGGNHLPITFPHTRSSLVFMIIDVIISSASQSHLSDNLSHVVYFRNSHSLQSTFPLHTLIPHSQGSQGNWQTIEKLKHFWNSTSCLPAPRKGQVFAWWPRRPPCCPWRFRYISWKEVRTAGRVSATLGLNDNQGPKLPSLPHHRARRSPKKATSAGYTWPSVIAQALVHTRSYSEKGKFPLKSRSSKQLNALHSTWIYPALYCLLETKQLWFWALNTMKVDHTNAVLTCFTVLHSLPSTKGV